MVEYLILDRDDDIIDEVTIEEGSYQDMIKEVVNRISNGELSLIDLFNSKVYVRYYSNFTKDLVKEFEKKEILEEENNFFNMPNFETAMLEIGGKIVTITIEERS